jgi:hypothetical protein
MPLRARLAWLVLAAPLAFYVAFIVRTPITFEGRTYFWLFDDAMISMRYARNLADGHGLVWNAGERVEGYSNFLWTLVMAAVHGLGFGDSGASLAMMARDRARRADRGARGPARAPARRRVEHAALLGARGGGGVGGAHA